MNDTPPRAPLAWRLVGALVLTGLFGLLILWNFAGLAFPPGPLSWLPGTLLTLLFLLAVLSAWKKLRLFSSPGPVIGWAVVLGASLVWLARDDAALTHPLTMEQLAPAPTADAAASYAVTLAFSQPGAQPAARTQPDLKFHPKNNPEEKVAEWAKEIAANPEKVSADFAATAPGRAWLAEMDKFAAIADSPTVALDTPVINLSVYRQTNQALCNQAAMLAQRDKGDEAADLLRLALSVAGKLEKHARAEVRILLAAAVLRRALATTDYVLATTPVSAEKRAALVAVLNGRDAADIRHRLAWVAYVRTWDCILNDPDQSFGEVMFADGGPRVFTTIVGWTRPVALLPRNTANLLAEFSAAVEKTLEDPKADTLVTDVALFYRRLWSPWPKNLGGRTLIAIAVPAYSKIAERLRATEESHAALLAKLRS